MKVGFVGWRGMVGSVLMQRMQEEQDFKHIPESVFFTTSNVGGTAPDFGQTEKTLLDANNITELAKNILRARASNSGKTLAELYDPDKMPDNLRQAHQALDAAVDKLYRDKPFSDGLERVEHLFGLYEKLIAAEQHEAENKANAKQGRLKEKA